MKTIENGTNVANGQKILRMMNESLTVMIVALENGEKYKVENIFSWLDIGQDMEHYMNETELVFLEEELCVESEVSV